MSYIPSACRALGVFLLPFKTWSVPQAPGGRGVHVLPAHLRRVKPLVRIKPQRSRDGASTASVCSGKTFSSLCLLAHQLGSDPVEQEFTSAPEVPRGSTRGRAALPGDSCWVWSRAFFTSGVKAPRGRVCLITVLQAPSLQSPSAGFCTALVPFESRDPPARCFQ